MSKLFIGNTTKQRLHLHYRMPERDQVFQLVIAPGGQTPLPFDVTQADIKLVLEQLAPYKPIDVAMIDRTRGEFIGVTYRIDTPIKEQQLQSGIAANDGFLFKRSEEAFANEGASLADMLAKTAQEQGTAVRETEVSVQEEFEGREPKNAIARKMVVANIPASERKKGSRRNAVN